MKCIIVNLYLSFSEYVDSVEINVFETASEVFLIAEEDLVEVAHPAKEHAEVHVQLVVFARKLNSARKKRRRKKGTC